MKPIAPAPAEAPALRSALLTWYERAARDLPWRRDRDPYRVLVSEIMLQQTRVETVIGYYESWLDRFPTIESLADASEDEVLKAWEGLGYYRRARNLHRAARLIRENRASFAGFGEPGVGSESFVTTVADRGSPATAEALRELPGVGEYTAGAVASIAFEEAVPAVDGNVRRVLARLFDVEHPKPAWLRQQATALVDAERPGDWNQALMELGATICTPRAPSCARCPLREACAARAAGTELMRPRPTKARPVPSARFALAVLERGERVLLERRPENGLLGGMWALPEVRLDEERGGEAAAAELAGPRGLEVVGRARPLPEVRHRFSHLDARYLPFVFAVEPTGGAGSEGRWIDPGADDVTALPVAQRKVLDSWLSAREGSAA